MRQAADQGHSEAEFVMGKFYFEGKVVSKDYNEAKRWFEKGDLKRFSPAQEALQIVNRVL